MESLYGQRSFICGVSRFLLLQCRAMVAVGKFSQLDMVAMEYFRVHFATDKSVIATLMRLRCDLGEGTLQPSTT